MESLLTLTHDRIIDEDQTTQTQVSLAGDKAEDLGHVMRAVESLLISIGFSIELVEQSTVDGPIFHFV